LFEQSTTQHNIIDVSLHDHIRLINLQSGHQSFSHLFWGVVRIVTEDGLYHVNKIG